MRLGFKARNLIVNYYLIEKHYILLKYSGVFMPLLYFNNSSLRLFLPFVQQGRLSALKDILLPMIPTTE
jgi:hypothetical protein